MEFCFVRRLYPFFSSIYKLHTPEIPVQNALTLRIKAHDVPEDLVDKLAVASVDEETGHTSYAGGKYRNGWVETSIRAFGSYTLVVDTIPPAIVSLSLKNNALTESSRLRFRISDSFSGIRDFKGYIDGKWALFETDVKTNIITHNFDASRFEFKKRHTFVLKVTDNQGNESVYESTFWK